MGNSWPKVIRDPVHDIVAFENADCDRLLLSLIDTREFQRSRRIKQLGMSDMVFPGANHSRFSHAIGVMRVARRILSRAKGIGLDIQDSQHIPVSVAALLHDIGHGPFSHAYEKATGDKHEARTLEIIRSASTEVNKRLREFSSTLPEQVGMFFDPTVDDEAREKAGIPRVLTQIISSQLDADRFDYLLRDSLMTGTDYGQFDLNWLLLQLSYDGARKRLFLSRKALSAAEAYVYARYHMYRSVYFHKATRAAEVMLRLIFKRYRDLLRLANSDQERRSIVPNTPPALFDVFADQSSLDCFLAVDDHTVTEFFKACGEANDGMLSMLGSGLITRALFKGIDVTDHGAASIAEFTGRAKEIVKANGLDPDCAFVDDTASDIPYKPYDPDAENPATQIYVEKGTGERKELSEVSESVSQLKKKYALLRYYYPASLRDKIEEAADAVFQKGV